MESVMVKPRGMPFLDPRNCYRTFVGPTQPRLLTERMFRCYNLLAFLTLWSR